MVDKQFYRFHEAAEALGVTVPAIKHYIRTGQLPAIGEYRGVLIGRIGLRHFLARRNGMPEDVTPTGFVYLFRFREYHKIGLSIDPVRRLQDIDSVYPEPVTMVHTIPTTDMYRAETMLHAQYAHCRARGEWFKLNGREVNTIQKTKALLFE